MQISRVQQGSFEWHKLRHGKVTGTTLKSALGSPKVQETLMYKLIAERMTEVKIEEINSAAIQHGKELEPVAKKTFERNMGIDFEDVGMLLSDEIPSYGVSPDGVHLVHGELIQGLEIKCPNSKKHIEYCMKDEIPAEYLHQVKAPFLLSDNLEAWHFISFDDRNYEKPLFQAVFTREQYTDLEADKQKLIDFLAMVDHKHMELTF